MTGIHTVTPDQIDITKIETILSEKVKLELSEDSKKRIRECREYLDRKLEDHSEPIYGINTGFGALHSTSISKENLNQLQKNLVVSHACGTGDEIPPEIVKLMLLLKVQGLSYGHSGVQLKTVERLIDFYNNDILPVIYEQGSLGASGDLAPLAHLALPLLGLGEVMVKGERKASQEVLQQFGWEPIELQSKEGLALLNGTQFMSAFGIWCLIQTRKLSRWADFIGALSLDAFDGRPEPFDHLVHDIRPHNGQKETARQLREILNESEILQRKKQHVQDPYSFRCIPQVHGASKDVISFVEEVFTREINSVTDNPTVFPKEDKIISAGNFHGQPLALGLDQLCLAVHELGSISERRIYKLISGQRNLPPFLVANPGLNSGFMIPQYTAASIVSQNKQLCTPASVDTIDSSNGQEDHVSMGANAATKTYRVVKNLERILAIELFTACQALEFRRPARSSDKVEQVFEKFRQRVSFVENDRVLHNDIQESIRFLRENTPDA